MCMLFTHRGFNVCGVLCYALVTVAVALSCSKGRAAALYGLFMISSVLH